MSDVIVEFCGHPLVLSADDFQRARERGRELNGQTPVIACGSSAEPLLDAEQAAVQLGVTARWLEDSARAGIVPHYKLGRFIRFNVREVAHHCRVEGAPIPSTSLESVGRNLRLIRQ